MQKKIKIIASDVIDGEIIDEMVISQILSSINLSAILCDEIAYLLYIGEVLRNQGKIVCNEMPSTRFSQKVMRSIAEAEKEKWVGKKHYAQNSKSSMQEATASDSTIETIA